jgi:hypothetical protein
LADENSRDRLFRAVKEHIKESDEQNLILMITNAIGDRRYRDLVDIIAGIESNDGWSTALEFLMKAQNQKYSSPISIGQDKTKLEELKYREMVFELLSCNGLEPVAIDTIELLKELDSESSLVDASHVLVPRLEELAVAQIQTGDTMFFDFSDNISVSQETVSLLDQISGEIIQSISLKQNYNLVNIEPLWYSEYGRLVLSQLGIKGNIVNSEIFDSVLSVIQVPISNKTRIVDISSFKSTIEDTIHYPSNTLYRKMHAHLIQHEINELSLLASRHSIPLLNTLLNEASSAYKNSSSTAGYKEILNYINAHISIRNVESILALEKSSQMKNTRIATTAILAIGNFYHESSVAALAKLLCTRKNVEIEKFVIKAIENVYKKCPEADHVITNLLNTECKNRGKLKKLHTRLSKKKSLYYQ